MADEFGYDDLDNPENYYSYQEQDDDEDWFENLTVPEILSISSQTSGLNESANPYGLALPSDEAAQSNSSDADIGGRTSGRGSASAGANGGGADSGSGGSIFGELSKFVESNKDAIGLGAGALAYWGKTISDNRNASQAADAAEVQRQQKEQDYQDAIARKDKNDQDAIARADAKDLVDFERKQQALKDQREYEKETAKQKQADAMAQLAFSRSSGGGGGGGGGIDQAAARAARVSASIMGMKKPTTGIVNSNIWGNAANTLQRK